MSINHPDPLSPGHHLPGRHRLEEETCGRPPNGPKKTWNLAGAEELVFERMPQGPIHIGDHLCLHHCSHEVASSATWRQWRSGCHWWGESLDSFVSSCQTHAQLRRRGSPGSAGGYWVAAFAMRQHELREELGASGPVTVLVHADRCVWTVSRTHPDATCLGLPYI